MSRPGKTKRLGGSERVPARRTSGLLEDEASGAASIFMGDLLGRPLTIRQGVGSEIVVRPHDDGTVEIGGRTEIVETREYPLGRSA
jgi:hypothetical protein